MMDHPRFTSSITFLYYEDYEYGVSFIEETFHLKLVMDQGFARVYQINEASFIGVVAKQHSTQYAGDTLVSFNTSSVKQEYHRIQQLGVKKLTPIQRMESIPLDSFFFEDQEGHRFEIQQFLDETIRNQF